jgi:hypothetical protein
MDSVHARFVNNSFAVFPRAQGASQLLSIFLTLIEDFFGLPSLS